MSARPYSRPDRVRADAERITGRRLTDGGRVVVETGRRNGRRFTRRVRFPRRMDAAHYLATVRAER